MTFKNDAIVLCRWKSDKTGNEPEILQHQPPGTVITDITGQDGNNIPPKPNIFVVYVQGLTDAQLTTLQARSQYLVLATMRYDDLQPGVILSTTLDDNVNGPAANAMVTQLKARFADATDGDLDDDEDRQPIFRGGRNRRAIIARLIRRMQRYNKAPSIAQSIGFIGE